MKIGCLQWLWRGLSQKTCSDQSTSSTFGDEPHSKTTVDGTCLEKYLYRYDKKWILIMQTKIFVKNCVPKLSVA